MTCMEPNRGNDTFVNDTSNITDTVDDGANYDQVENILYHYVLPVICCFGILGNILNLMILSRKSLTVHMERLEKCAHSHLIALAVSDLLYCITFLPSSVKPMFVDVSYISLWLLYDAYHVAVVNTFLMFSGWLTVAMAVCRYIAICYPMKALQYLGVMTTRMDIGVIFLISVLFNVPRYFIWTIEKECQKGEYVYFAFPGALRRNPLAEDIYQWIYFVVGIILPLTTVAYCNFYFIRALRASENLRQRHTRHQDNSTSHNLPSILTLTLSIIVVLYILLVVPAEIIIFFKDYIKKHFEDAHYSLAVAICNNLQTFNFAVNFLLYCMINVHFRSVITNALHCRFARPNHRRIVTWGVTSTMLTHNNATTML